MENKATIQFWLPKALKKKAERAAKKLDLSLTQYLRRLIRNDNEL